MNDDSSQTVRSPVDAVLGFAAVLAGHAALGMVASAVNSVATTEVGLVAMAVLFLGVVQLVYVLPLAIWSWRSGRRPFTWGTIAAAALTALCNGACWAVVSTMRF